MANSSNSVVHVSSVHPYTDNRIHYRECKSLLEAGFDVTLVAVESSVNGPLSGVTVVTIPRQRRRIARMLLSSFIAVRHAFRTKAKIVHMHDPELIPYIPLLRLMRRFVIYDAHEDLPAQIMNKPYVNRSSARLLSLFASALVSVSRMSNVIVCATETIAMRYPPSKTVLVHNYPPLREAEADTAGLGSRAACVVYVGGISEQRGASVMVDAMTEKSMPTGWRLRIAGTLPETLLDDLRERDGWRHVDFEGQVPPDVARDIILNARIGLVLFADNVAHRDALPTKMFEYFAAGVPVIASDFPLWRTIVEEHDCGILVSPDSPTEVAAAIRRYADDAELLQRHSRNARSLAVTSLNWAPEGQTLVDAYSELLKK